MRRFVDDGHLALFTMVTNRHTQPSTYYTHAQVCVHSHTHTHSQGGGQNQDLCVRPETLLFSHAMEGKYLDQVSHAISVLTG